MTDTFISYKSEDRERVGELVDLLRGSGIAVWWDQDIPPAAPWEASITAALAAARCVIVCWTVRSIDSAAGAKVQVEAREALDQGKLIQVLLDRVQPPLFFRHWQAIDLSTWRDGAASGHAQSVVQAVRDILAGRKPATLASAPRRRQTIWSALIALGAAVSAGVGLTANIGGARDLLCGMSAFESTCAKLGLVSATAESVQARTRLIHSVAGIWGPPGCARTFAYRVDEVGDETHIVSVGAEYQSVGRVVSADAGGVFTRLLSPAHSAGEQWELRPDGDRMSVIDKDGVATTLVRCQ